MSKLKVGQRLVLAANERTTVVLRRFRPGPESRDSRVELAVYDAGIEEFDRPPGFPVDARGRPVGPLARVSFEDESRARQLARAIGTR